MHAHMQPLYWRIQNTDTSGFDVVSLLMPATDSEPATVLPTDVSFCSRRLDKKALDIKWSEDDSDLFLSLLDRLSLNLEDEVDDEGLVLDINDDVVQGIVQLVALARFKTPWPTDELVGEDFNTEREEVEVGDLISVNTSAGFYMAIIVAMDSIDVTCILMEDIVDQGEQCIMPEHSVLVLNRSYVLPLAFADSDLGEEAVFH